MLCKQNWHLICELHYQVGKHEHDQYICLALFIMKLPEFYGFNFIRIERVDNKVNNYAYEVPTTTQV